MNVRKPTISEIARAAGVSATTVDRVVNGRANVHPRTVALVQEAIGNLRQVYDSRPPVRMTFIVHSGPNPSLDSFADALVSEAGAMRENIEVTVKRVRINDPIGLAVALDEANEVADASCPGRATPRLTCRDRGSSCGRHTAKPDRSPE